MEVAHEYGRKVFVVSPVVVRMLSPLFGRSLPHRGRVLRGIGRRRGPVIRDRYGKY